MEPAVVLIRFIYCLVNGSWSLYSYAKNSLEHIDYEICKFFQSILLILIRSRLDSDSQIVLLLILVRSRLDSDSQIVLLLILIRSRFDSDFQIVLLSVLY